MKTMALIAAAIVTGCSSDPGTVAEPTAITVERDAAALANHRLDAGSLPELRLVATSGGRELLARVVSCALPRGTAITTITSDGTPYSFVGALGLAPSWAQRAPSHDERRRVIACVRGAITV
jgi:hypothetical protein